MLVHSISYDNIIKNQPNKNNVISFKNHSNMERSIMASQENIESKGVKKFIFNSNKEEKTTNKGGAIIATTLATVALGTTIYLTGKKSMKEFKDVLLKRGVAIKDGLAIVQCNEQRYTGSITYNLKPFGIKKETIKFVDGKLSEKTTSNIFGKELEGKFYKDGVMRVSVGQGKTYSLNMFDKDGKLILMGDVRNEGKTKFAGARKMIEELKD